VGEKLKVLTLGSMDPAVDAELSKRFEVLRDETLGLENILAKHGPEIVAIATRGRAPTTAQLLDRLPKLEIVANFGVGYDSIDVPAAVKRGIMVTNTPDVLNDEMGDFTVGLLLATIRRLPQADRYIRAGRWQPGAEFPLGPSLRARKIGIAGMGRIGKVVAKRLSGFDLPISYCGRREQPGLGHRYYPDIVSLAKAVDILIVILPGGPQTRHAINADVLAALGPNGVLINVARGSVADEAAVIEALRSGTILAAGLDVFEREPHVPEALLAMDNAVVLPHIGTATHHTRCLMRQLVAGNIFSWFDGKGAITLVPEAVSIQARAAT
jgi:lactate dehydrogenase-like 2-hydroxyacid dehydrogenase